MDFKDTAKKIQEYIERRFVTGGNRIDEAYAYAMENPGKMLRPLMTSAVARSYGVQPAVYIPLAASIEIINTSTLVLDDMPSQDNAEIRRGRNSVWKECGEDIASLITPFAFGEIMKILSEIDLENNVLKKILGELGETSQLLARGQAIDLRNLEDGKVDATRVLDCYSLKTGSLFSCANVVGAHLGQASDLETTHLRRFGLFFGKAYQVADEILDYHRPEEVGKSTGKDSKKATLRKLTPIKDMGEIYGNFIEIAEQSLKNTGRDFSELQELVAIARQKMEESLFSKKAVEQNGQQVRSS